MAEITDPWSSQLRKGLIELCVLAVLRDDDAYGYLIVQRLSAGGLPVSESTVYPILARLEQDRVLSVRTVPSTSGPPRRYYRLTTAGQARLRAMERHWQELTGAIAVLLAANRRTPDQKATS